ncbi:MAG TPA: hypothetical protein VNN55_11585 [bacterium]|nr:hypothetical protein [bacterium]
MRLVNPTEPDVPARINPMRVWRWGFSAVLIGVGLWLVATAPTIGGASGRTLGWVIMGYALVRLALGWLSDRGKSRI